MTESLAAAHAVPRLGFAALLGHFPLRHRQDLAIDLCRDIVRNEVDVSRRLVHDFEANGLLLARAQRVHAHRNFTFEDLGDAFRDGVLNLVLLDKAHDALLQPFDFETDWDASDEFCWVDSGADFF